MPTNLPPEAVEAEGRYRAAQSLEEKITTLEEFISAIPRHKGTDRLRAGLRRKLSKLKAASQTRKSTTKQVSAFHIDREGAGQIVVVGPANAGKSALVAALTNAAPEVAEYPFTTWAPTPGMMPIEDIQVQLIDTPSLDRDFVEPELLNLVRRADLILLVVDLQTYPIEQLEGTVAFLEAHRIVPEQSRERYVEEQELTFKPLLVVVNKNDDAGSDPDFAVLRELLGDGWSLVPVSAAAGRNFEALKQAVFRALEIIRVYSKPPGEKPDLGAPYVLKKGSTVEELAGKVHQDLRQNLKAARVWGSATHDGQMVSRDHVLEDGDVVELRT